MREFKFDPATRRAVLNGRRVFCGGPTSPSTGFEDDDCRLLPWTDSWVRLLHQREGNALEFVPLLIGFPPEAWYEIADELGILIQDEFPLWRLSDVKRGQLEKEYRSGSSWNGATIRAS